MPRRPRSRASEESYPERGRLVRQHFKPGGNEGLWWALGAAGVIGLVVILMISGGSGGMAEKEAATATLRAIFKAALAADEKTGVNDTCLEMLPVPNRTGSSLRNLPDSES